MKYYPNYILKRLTPQQYESMKNVIINGQMLCFKYDKNPNYYYVRVDS